MNAQRMRACIREQDLAARLGGDEFAVIIRDAVSMETVSAVLRKIHGSLEQPFRVDDREFYVSSSIGVSLFPDDGEESQQLLRHADLAMYAAKDRGRNTFQFYTPELGNLTLDRVTLESSLRQALKSHQLQIYYQAQVDLKTERITGVEALVRWHHPELGLVPPMQFIPILEENGLIVPVGEWILQTACTQLQTWRADGLDIPRIAVNFSSKQFLTGNLHRAIERILSQTGLAPGSLEVEVTETIMMRELDASQETLRYLNRLGVHLAIDDFGTGYSSLSYLHRFPVQTLKIDRSFIENITESTDTAAIVKAIVAMANALGLQVVAEGVERDAQLDLLRSFACTTVQGHLVNVPSAASEMGHFLKRYRDLSATGTQARLQVVGDGS